mmetsp:Transcript_861/g.5380  ORF Transcript_861/g.5380 Transcript_861/m.5380 type:complete len:216 (-) Transcript_861:409-1056(-)
MALCVLFVHGAIFWRHSDEFHPLSEDLLADVRCTGKYGVFQLLLSPLLDSDADIGRLKDFDSDFLLLQFPQGFFQLARILAKSLLRKLCVVLQLQGFLHRLLGLVFGLLRFDPVVFECYQSFSDRIFQVKYGLRFRWERPACSSFVADHFRRGPMFVLNGHHLRLRIDGRNSRYVFFVFLSPRFLNLHRLVCFVLDVSFPLFLVGVCFLRCDGEF